MLSPWLFYTKFKDHWSLTPQSLDEYCNNRQNPEIPLVLVFNYPNNLTGQTFTATQLQALAEVMRKHKVVVIADEIYSLLVFKDRQVSIADYYPEGCIVSSGLSKWCGAGGWRLGFVHISCRIRCRVLSGCHWGSHLKHIPALPAHTNCGNHRL